MDKKFLKGFTAGALLFSAAAGVVFHWQNSPEQKLRRALRLQGAYAWNKIETIGKEMGKGAAVEELRLHAEDGSTTAYLLYPDPKPPGKIPAVILLHGHLSEAGEFLRAKKDSRLKPLAPELARAGFAVLVPQARYELSDMKEETRQALQFILSGRTLMGERVADVFRSLRFLKSLNFIEKDRIGILGWSMGGQIALYSMALEPSLRAGFISGSATSLEVALLPETPLQTADNYVPNLMEDFGDKADLICMAAPRPLFIEHGSRDASEPLGGVMLTLDKAKACYSSISAENALRHQWHSGGHTLDASAALEWFRRGL